MAKYKNVREIKPNETFHTFLLGAAENANKVAVATQLEMKSMEIAKKKNFKRILSVATHPFTIQLAYSFGYKLLYQFYLPDFEYNGIKPFSKIPVGSSDTIKLFELNLE